ncbi:MAG: ABC transporter permease [Candidatus Firestonebacteria bacterium]
MRRLIELVRKEFIQTMRDKRMLALIFVAPVLQLLLLGYAVTTDVKHIYLSVWDTSRSKESRDIISKTVNSGYFDYTGDLNGEEQIEAAFKSGRCDIVLYFPPDFSKKIKRSEKARIEVIADGSDSNLTGIAFGYLGQIINIENSRLQSKNIAKLKAARGRDLRIPAVFPEPRILYNPEMKSANYMVPGVIGLILTLITILLTSMSITKEKESGTIEQLIVSPLRSYEVIIGKTIPFAAIGMVIVLVVVSAGMFIFGIELKGSLFTLLFASLLFLLNTLGIGLFISTISRTQQQAMLSSIIFILPSMMISGFAFPVGNMPVEIQWLSYLIPLRYFFVIIRGVFLKGIGFAELWPQMLALFFLGATVFVLAALRFRKKLS